VPNPVPVIVRVVFCPEGQVAGPTEGTTGSLSIKVYELHKFTVSERHAVNFIWSGRLIAGDGT
jgi:hypothetical protein